MKNKFVRLTGCIVSLFLVVATVIYIVYFFGIVCNYNVNWIRTFFLYYGLVAFIIPLPMITKSFTIIACSINKQIDCSKNK